MKTNTSERENQPSIIRSLFEYAKNRKMEIGEDNVFDFSIGNPNVPVPEEVNELLIKLIKETDPIKLHGYTANTGMPEVKKAVADYINKKYGAPVSEDLIYITCGASPAIVFVIHSILSKDNEAIIFAPYFPEYTHYIDYIGGHYKVVDPDKNFLPDLEDFKNKITDKTALVIINSPNNPSGVFYPEEVIKDICHILKGKEKEYGHPIYLLSDEPYRELLYGEKKYPFVPCYYDDSLVTYSYSKTLSLAGERLGYLHVNPKADHADEVFTKAVHAGHCLGYVSTPSLFQLLLPLVVDKKIDLTPYIQNRDLFYKSLTDIGFEIPYPDGAFYMLVKAPDGDANRFMENGKKFEIIMVPCDEFGLKGYVRLAYCVNQKVIKNSIPAFKKLYELYEGK